ncbi:MAG TPA: ABC transporter substrate-binding protein [Acetobacteraceae bacterium]|nr:ABC transporter substrate-binding protein [Acetobacteraceae bacterium]
MHDAMMRVAARPTRRGFLAASAGALAGLAAPAVHAAKPIRIGYVSPQTGPLAPFAASDAFVIGLAREAFKKQGRDIEILVRDSQSNPNRAAAVAGELINAGVSLMLVASTPETTNPVSDQCELGEVPCVATVAPWQPWFFTRGGKPDQGFEWTYLFFWGLEDVIAVFTAMWKQLATNKTVGGLFPNDGDGNAWGSPKLGFPPVLARDGYKLIDPGRFQDGSDNFSAQINAFKSGNAEIVTGVVIPPDWTTFWTQANQQGFRPKIASVGKALLFPTSVEALGGSGNNLSTEIWWGPRHPFRSSLTGQSAGELAASYTRQSGKQWTQPIGFVEALFELAADITKRAADPLDRPAVLDALTRTSLDTVVGHIAWDHGPVKNVAKTPLVGGQWRLTRGGPFPYELVVTTNTIAPMIPVASQMQPIT